MPNREPSAFAPGVAIAFVSLTLFFGCARSVTSSEELDLAQAQLDTLWLGLSAAMMAGDTSRLSAFYSDSALFAETGTPTLVGLARIQAAAASVFACCRYRESRVRPEITEVSGRRAFQFGTYRDVIEPAGQAPMTFHGRFAAILDRGSSNAWYVTRLMVIRDSSIPPFPAR
jgi:ketosteroid isomerase-like protein